MHKLNQITKARKGNIRHNIRDNMRHNMRTAPKFGAKFGAKFGLLLACLLLGANIQLAKAQEVGGATPLERLKRSSDCSPADASHFVEQKAQALLKQIQKKQAEQKTQKALPDSPQKRAKEIARQKKYKNIYATILKQAFAFETVARTLIGPYWRKMSAQQRSEYTELISDILNLSISNTIYTLQVKSYSLEGASSLGKDFAVRLQVNIEQANLGQENLEQAKLEQKAEAIPIVWRVRCFQSENLESKNMGIVDLLFRNVSVIAGKRAEMTALLSKRGVTEFLVILKGERDRIAAQ